MTIACRLSKARIVCAIVLACACLPANALELPDGDEVANVGANAITVDLATLEKRVRETKGISPMKKLALKGEIDNLLDQFRTYYGSSSGTPVALRQPYERLLDKVTAGLRDKDPALAKAIAASRDSIWAALSDSNKFAGL